MVMSIHQAKQAKAVFVFGYDIVYQTDPSEMWLRGQFFGVRFGGGMLLQLSWDSEFYARA